MPFRQKKPRSLLTAGETGTYNKLVIEFSTVRIDFMALRRARIKLRVPQKLVAELVGVSPASMSAYEHGASSIPGNVLLRLLLLYNCPPEEISTPELPAHWRDGLPDGLRLTGPARRARKRKDGGDR